LRGQTIGDEGKGKKWLKTGGEKKPLKRGNPWGKLVGVYLRLKMILRIRAKVA
jgi:hypothetical protein